MTWTKRFDEQYTNLMEWSVTAENPTKLTDKKESVKTFIQKELEAEAEKWITAINYNVSYPVFHRIKDAKNALDKKL